MNPLEEVLAELSTSQQERVRVAFASYEEGLLTSSEFVDVVTAVVLSGNAHAYALGATSVRSLIEAKVAAVEITPAVAQPHHLDDVRISTALTTVLASETDTLMQLQRIADNEPKQAAADGSGDVLAASERVTGWTRALDSKACELCRWLAKDGFVFPDSEPLVRHTGCVCSQDPVIA